MNITELLDSFLSILKLTTVLEKVLTAGIPILISFFALWVSIRTRRDSNRNNRQQILVGKIEEIYENVTTLHYYYSALLFVFDKLHQSHNHAKWSASERADWLKDYKGLVEQFIERNNVDDLYNKTSRLKILANTYLSGKLQRKCLAYNDMFEKLMDTVIHQQKLSQEIFYAEGFPDNLVLHTYVESIQEELVNLTQLGGNAIKQSEISEYRSTTFKKDLGLIK